MNRIVTMQDFDFFLINSEADNMFCSGYDKKTIKKNL